MRNCNLLCAALCLTACGGGREAKSPGNTPRATANAMLKAFADHDAKAGYSLLPPLGAISRTFDCPEQQMSKKVQRDRRRVQRQLAKLEAKNVTIAIVEFDKKGSEAESYAPGDDYEGCKVKAPITVHRSNVTLKIASEGKSNTGNETWTFFRFGDEKVWYYVQ